MSTIKDLIKGLVKEHFDQQATGLLGAGTVTQASNESSSGATATVAVGDQIVTARTPYPVVQGSPVIVLQAGGSYVAIPNHQTPKHPLDKPTYFTGGGQRAIWWTTPHGSLPQPSNRFILQDAGNSSLYRLDTSVTDYRVLVAISPNGSRIAILQLQLDLLSPSVPNQDQLARLTTYSLGALSGTQTDAVNFLYDLTAAQSWQVQFVVAVPLPDPSLCQFNVAETELRFVDLQIDNDGNVYSLELDTSQTLTYLSRDFFWDGQPAHNPLPNFYIGNLVSGNNYDYTENTRISKYSADTGARTTIFQNQARVVGCTGESMISAGFFILPDVCGVTPTLTVTPGALPNRPLVPPSSTTTGTRLRPYGIADITRGRVYAREMISSPPGFANTGFVKWGSLMQLRDLVAGTVYQTWNLVPPGEAVGDAFTLSTDYTLETLYRPIFNTLSKSAISILDGWNPGYGSYALVNDEDGTTYSLHTPNIATELSPDDQSLLLSGSPYWLMNVEKSILLDRAGQVWLIKLDLSTGEWKVLSRETNISPQDSGAPFTEETNSFVPDAFRVLPIFRTSSPLEVHFSAD